VAKVKPIFKKGDECEMGDYRSISLLPIVSKFIEKAICDQLAFYLETNNLLNGRQYGFRKPKSTKLALIDIFNDCIDAMEAGETVIGTLADLSKAFDCVDAAIPFQKLVALGIKDAALEWIISYMSGRCQATKFEFETKTKVMSVLSTKKLITIGVPSHRRDEPQFTNFLHHFHSTRSTRWPDGIGD
jgi:hypothetical protein